MTKENNKTTECHGCGVDIEIKNDQWWQYSWKEHPAKETVEKAIDNPDFRDWVQENYVFCTKCHDRIQSVVKA